MDKLQRQQLEEMEKDVVFCKENGPINKFWKKMRYRKRKGRARRKPGLPRIAYCRLRKLLCFANPILFHSLALLQTEMLLESPCTYDVFVRQLADLCMALRRLVERRARMHEALSDVFLDLLSDL